MQMDRSKQMLNANFKFDARSLATSSETKIPKTFVCLEAVRKTRQSVKKTFLSFYRIENYFSTPKIFDKAKVLEPPYPSAKAFHLKIALADDPFRRLPSEAAVKLW